MSAAGSRAEVRAAARAAAAEIARLGAGAVETDPAALVKLSSDWSRMSPVLSEKVPPGRYVADVAVRPRTGDDVAAILAVAFAAGVPVTPRGAGTGNYGQATPFDGGILLDLRGLDTVRVNDAGTVTVGAGARLTTIDRVGRAAGRDIWLFPSTKHSTAGGFLGGGSVGTGTIEHGTTTDGFVTAATVVPMDGSGRTVPVSGAALEPYVHAYGVTGIVVEAELATDDRREWVALYAAFDSYRAVTDVHRQLLDLPVRPRLASADEPALVPTLTTPVALDPERHSLRVIAEASTVAALTALVRTGGGDVVAVLADYAETDRLSGMSYNHPVWFLQRARPRSPLFHMEIGGRPLWDDPDAVRDCYPGPVHLHLELFGHGPGAMLVAPYRSEEEVLAGIPRMEAAGLDVHSPHQWFVDRNVGLVIDTAARTDPRGLLNPGKLLPEPPSGARVNIGVR
ncbi:FAD-binding oxidoreductase [Cryptosporangium arvum]|uniref:FAD-binding oxidoreductase n=1 Tax=Cryptosporangium arvum TaxID=80871 RepID=UPI0004B7C1F7|nr:FAD-binding oxidoreductase [Cryptosporangium arvum]